MVQWLLNKLFTPGTFLIHSSGLDSLCAPFLSLHFNDEGKCWLQLCFELKYMTWISTRPSLWFLFCFSLFGVFVSVCRVKVLRPEYLTDHHYDFCFVFHCFFSIWCVCVSVSIFSPVCLSVCLSVCGCLSVCLSYKEWFVTHQSCKRSTSCNRARTDSF